MPLSVLSLDEKYFFNYKDQKQPIKSIFFDNQFSVFSHYLNNEVRPYLNQLIDGRIPGTDNFNSIGKILRFFPQYNEDNNLITNLLWDTIKGDDILDHSIPYSKINTMPPSSIFSADENENFTPIVSTENNQVLVSQSNGVSIWRKLRGDDLPDRLITGDMTELASIPADAFVEGTIKTELTDNIIDNKKFPDRAITRSKLADQIIDEVIMGPELAKNFLDRIGSAFIPLDSVDLSRVPVNNLDNLQLFKNLNLINERLFANIEWEERVFKSLDDAAFLAPKSITGDKMDDQIIPANNLQYYVSDIFAEPGIRTLIDNGAVEVEHLDNELKAYLHL